MPRKFRRVVRKRYSMAKTDRQASASSEEFVEMVDAETQTEENVKLADAGTQAEPLTTETSMQTDDTVVLSETLTSSETNNLQLVGDKENQYVLCEGNNDEKFYPLVLKHNGIFKDSSGMYNYV